MGTGKTAVSWLEMRLARLLVTKPATPVILAGSLALAGLSAAAMNPAKAQQSPIPTNSPSLLLGSPHTFCYPDPDGDGHTICHILASQVNTIPNLGCYADPDGDGTYVCFYATDPSATN